MRVILVTILAAAATAGPVPAGRYSVSVPDNSISLHGQARQLQNAGGLTPVAISIEQPDTADFSNQGISIGSLEIDDDNCLDGQLRHGNRCVVPRINRNIFVFGREDSGESKSFDNSPELPLPTLDYNIIFVRSKNKQKKPIIAPPPQKKTIVYVLEDEHPEEIYQAPVHPQQDPEVFYVKVRDGENPQLPGGIDLQTAYSQALQQNVANALSGGEGGLSVEVDLEALAANAAATGGAGVALPGGSGGGDFGAAAGGIAGAFENVANNLGLNSGFRDDGGFQGQQGNFGVPLPNPSLGGGSPFDNQNVGVPLPPISGNFGQNDRFSLSNAGVPLPPISLGNQQGFNSNTGVPLPPFSRSVDAQAKNVGVELPPAKVSTREAPVITMEMIRNALLGDLGGSGDVEVKVELEPQPASNYGLPN